MRLWWFPLIVACNGRCGREPDTCEDAERRTWYADEDGDGHGDPQVSSERCEQPAGTVPVGDDCDDWDATSWESAGLWPDQDGDGYGTGSAVDVCAGAEGYAEKDGDCDDQDTTRAPDAALVCGDEIDQDCDGLADCELPTGAEAVAEVASTRFYGEPGGALGSAVAGLGDLDGDGLADLGLGAPLADPWGAAQVYFGPTEAIEDANSADIFLSSVETDADEESIEVGSALAAADVTGDGERDLIVGAGGSWFSVKGDTTYIFPGPMTAGDVVVNEDASAITLLGAGGKAYITDVDYSGSDDVDLLVGSGIIELHEGPIVEGGYSDEVRTGIIYGSGDLGLAMSIGDLNADGKVDLVAGASVLAHDLPGVETDGDLGGALLSTSASDFSREEGFPADADLAIYGYTDGAQLGASVAFAGDRDGDGYDDLYVGAPGALDEDGEATGAVYYFDGATLAALDRESEIYADAATFTVYGGEAGDEFGASLVTRLNLDDQATLVIGAPGHDDETGAVALWYEQPTAGDTLYEADYRLSGTAAGDRFGATLANAGDTNGLGWDDLLIGAPGTSGSDGAGWLLVFDQL